TNCTSSTLRGGDTSPAARPQRHRRVRGRTRGAGVDAALISPASGPPDGLSHRHKVWVAGTRRPSMTLANTHKGSGWMAWWRTWGGKGVPAAQGVERFEALEEPLPRRQRLDAARIPVRRP